MVSQKSSLVVDDLVIVARAAPTASKKHGRTVCTAAWSSMHRRFFRLYPVPFDTHLPRWSVCRAELYRNPSDTRAESWKIDSLDIHDRGDGKATYRELKKFASGSIHSLNECRVSMGVISNAVIDRVSLDVATPQETEDCLFGESHIEQITRRPRIKFFDSSGEHNCLLLDWGCSMLVNERGYTESHDLHKALRLDTELDRLLLVGNLSNHRNVYVVIALLNGEKKEQVASLFDEIVSA